MPLSMNLDTSNKVPLVTPCLDGKELEVDSEIVSAGLSAISVKGFETGDRREEIGMRCRNSFWSVHRPELSKLNWASNHTTQNIEEYLKVRAGNQESDKEFKESDVPSADFNLLNVIHSDVNQHAEPDEKYLHMSKPKTNQFSDDDVAGYTTVHKSRAEFCVTIGHLGKPSISATPDDFSSEKLQKNDGKQGSGLCSSDGKLETGFPPEQTVRIETNKNQEQAVLSRLDDEQGENTSFNGEPKDKRLLNSSRELLIALMDDKTQTC